MKIAIPINWKIVDLLKTQSADDFGDALRGLCFVGNCEAVGCYSTFDMHPCFKEVTEGEIFEEAKSNLYEDIPPNIYHFKLEEEDCWMDYYVNETLERSKICDPHEIVIGWTWDGDGCLYFRFNNRKAVNTDCKKSYGWEWVK